MAGCSPSSFLARKMMQAPNRVPECFKPAGRVVLRWPAGVLERFPGGTNIVGSPPAPLYWQIIEPADYKLQTSSEIQTEGRHFRAEFDVRFELPTNGLPTPRPAIGTAFILHGYGVDRESMFPWAMYLAEAQWRTVLVDLRGHGLSGGRRVFFGTRETNDLCELRRQLEGAGIIRPPYVCLGHSLGGAIALRWQTVDPAILGSVAMGAPAEFAPAAGRLRSEYASWVPAGWVRRATEKLPSVMSVEPEALDTTAALRGKRVKALLVAGHGDPVTPPEDSTKLRPLLAEGSGFLIVGPITHESLPYIFDQHGGTVRDWLQQFGSGQAP